MNMKEDDERLTPSPWGIDQAWFGRRLTSPSPSLESPRPPPSATSVGPAARSLEEVWAFGKVGVSQFFAFVQGLRLTWVGSWEDVR